MSLEDEAATELHGMPARPLSKQFQPVELHNLEFVSIPAPAFAIEPLVPAGVVTLLSAHGGAGKSVLALTWAAHYAAGKDWGGMRFGHGRTAFVSLEDPGSLVQFRVRRIAKVCGLDLDAIAENLTVLDGSEGDPSLVTEEAINGVRRLVATAAFNELFDAVEGCSLIVIDNASDAFDGDENARRQVRGFVRRLARLARDNGAGVILLAHVDKIAARFNSNGNSYSGSTAWHNSVRSRLALVTREKGTVDLVHEKANLSRTADAIALVWHDLGLLIPQATAPRDTVAMQLQADSSAEEEILAALKAAADAGVAVPTSRVGPSNALAVLTTIPKLPAWARGKSGREQFWTVMGRLLEKGRVARVEYTDGNRHRKERFEAADSAQVLRAGSPLIPPAQEPAKPAQGFAGCASSDE